MPDGSAPSALWAVPPRQCADRWHVSQAHAHLSITPVPFAFQPAGVMLQAAKPMRRSLLTSLPGKTRCFYLPFPCLPIYSLLFTFSLSSPIKSHQLRNTPSKSPCEVVRDTKKQINSTVKDEPCLSGVHDLFFFSEMLNYAPPRSQCVSARPWRTQTIFMFPSPSSLSSAAA